MSRIEAAKSAAFEFRNFSAFETFRDVIGDREGTAVELVPFGPRDSFFGRQYKILATFRKANGFVPDGQVLEAFVSGHGRGWG